MKYIFRSLVLFLSMFFAISSVIASSAQSYDSACAKVTFPSSVSPGQSVTMKVWMKNTGKKSWKTSDNISLAEVTGSWSVIDKRLPRNVRSNQTSPLSVILVAPSKTGQHELAIGLKKNGAYFGKPCEASIAVVETAKKSSSSSTSSATSSRSSLTVSSSSSSSRTYVRQSADVKVLVTGVNASVKKGEILQYLLSVENIGPDDAANVVLRSFSANTTDFNLQQSDSRCVVPRTYRDPTLECAFGTLKKGQKVDFSLAFNTSQYVCPNSLAPVFAITSDTTDPVKSNNDDYLGVTLQCADPDLSDINYSFVYSYFFAGVPQIFHAHVRNDGKALANNTTFTISIPAGAIFVPSLSSPSCVQQSASVVCSLGILSVGANIDLPLAFDHETSHCTPHSVIMESFLRTTSANKFPLVNTMTTTVDVDC